MSQKNFAPKTRDLSHDQWSTYKLGYYPSFSFIQKENRRAYLRKRLRMGGRGKKDEKNQEVRSPVLQQEVNHGNLSGDLTKM